MLIKHRLTMNLSIPEMEMEMEIDKRMRNQRFISKLKKNDFFSMIASNFM